MRSGNRGTVYDDLFCFSEFFRSAAACGEKTKLNNRAHAHTHNVARVERVGRTGYWSRTSHEQQQASMWRRRRRRSYFLFRDHNDCVVYNNNNIRSRRCVCVFAWSSFGGCSCCRGRVVRTRGVWCIRLRRRCSAHRRKECVRDTD